MPTRPYVIAIAGPSCSGKTSVARKIDEVLSATIFSLDAYYHDLANLSFDERAAFNFDHPQSLDEPLLIRHILDLAEGREVVRPIYDFTTHTRTSATEVIRQNPYLIVEGLFTLHWEELRPVYSTKVFMDAVHKVCLPRREERDIAERGRTRESVHQQYSATVQPMADQFIYPTREFADLVLDATEPIDDSAAKVLEHIRKTEQR
ncbi:MAG TPA: uridine kinase [Terriglobales bacterium]|nr:uridine kinase [Terriglobales bacterium]